MSFDPIEERQTCIRTAIPFISNTIYEMHRPMGNVAAYNVRQVISIWLSNLPNEVKPILPRAIEWLDIALAKGEVMGGLPLVHRNRLLTHKALALWMHKESSAAAVWAEASRCNSLVSGESYGTPAEMKNAILDEYLAECFQGGLYAEGVEAFERLHGRKDGPLSKVNTPKGYAYLLCRQALGEAFSDDDLRKVGRRVLRMNLNAHWLGRGQYSRAAMWLKIVHWRAGCGLTPLQVIHKAYEDMPTVETPDFIKNVL